MSIIFYFLFIFFRMGAYPFFLKGRNDIADVGYLFWLRIPIMIAGIVFPVVLWRFQFLQQGENIILYVCEALTFIYLSYLAVKAFFLKQRKDIFLIVYSFASALLVLLLCIRGLNQIQTIQYLVYLILLSWGLSQFLFRSEGLFKRGLSFEQPIFSLFIMFYLLSLYGIPLGLGFNIKTFSLKLIIEGRPIWYWCWIALLHCLLLFSFYHFSFKSLIAKQEPRPPMNNRKEAIWFALISSALMILGLYPRFFEMMATWGWR